MVTIAEWADQVRKEWQGIDGRTRADTTDPADVLHTEDAARLTRHPACTAFPTARVLLRTDADMPMKGVSLTPDFEDIPASKSVSAALCPHIIEVCGEVGHWHWARIGEKRGYYFCDARLYCPGLCAATD